MGIIEGGVKRAPITRTFEYDFAADGGAQGAIALSDADGRSGVIPDDAIITGATLEGITTATSGGSATIALGITGNTDAFASAAAFDGGTFDADVVTVSENDLPVKVDSGAGVSVLATIATADLTAGKCRLHVTYLTGS